MLRTYFGHFMLYLMAIMLLSCDKEVVFTSNSIDRTSDYFKDDNSKIVFNIISDHIHRNSQLLYSKIQYPGNSVGHLFAVKTPESKDKRREILFKVVDNRNSEYAMHQAYELTVFKDDKDYKLIGVDFEATQSQVRISNDEFTITLR